MKHKAIVGNLNFRETSYSTTGSPIRTRGRESRFGVLQARLFFLLVCPVAMDRLVFIRDPRVTSDQTSNGPRCRHDIFRVTRLFPQTTALVVALNAYIDMVRIPFPRGGPRCRFTRGSSRRVLGCVGSTGGSATGFWPSPARSTGIILVNPRVRCDTRL